MMVYVAVKVTVDPDDPPGARPRVEVIGAGPTQGSVGVKVLMDMKYVCNYGTEERVSDVDLTTIALTMMGPQPWCLERDGFVNYYSTQAVTVEAEVKPDAHAE